MGRDYDVVGQFEEALAEYTGAPYVVTTNSCTMAIQLAVRYTLERRGDSVEVPKRTYCSVPMAVQHAGGHVLWRNRKWRGEYQLYPLPVWDSARRFTWGMYRSGQMQCVSFQTSKILGLEQGGAILLDDKDAAEWLRRARYDGREAGERFPRQVGWHCYLNPSTAAIGLQRLSCLPANNPDQCGSEAFKDLSRLKIW